MKQKKKEQTAVDWIVSVVQSCIAPDYIPEEIVRQAKEMEKEKEHELKQLWFGRGIVAAKEDKISELKPKRE